MFDALMIWAWCMLGLTGLNSLLLLCLVSRRR